MLRDDDTRTNHTDHGSIEVEKRGRPSKLSPKDLERADRYLQDLGWEGRTLTWEELAQELDLNVTGKILHDHLGSMNYHKFIACTKGWVSKRTAKERVEYAQTILERHPEPEDWDRVRFSNEVHWSVSQQGKARIIRRPGERYCSDCIQEQLHRQHEQQNERLHS